MAPPARQTAEGVRRLRDNTKATLLAHQTWAQSASEKSTREIQRRIQQIDAKYAEITALNDELLLLDADETSEFIIEMEAIYLELISKLETILDGRVTNDVENNSAMGSEYRSCHDDAPTVRLPKRNLPQFSDKTEDWPSFYQRFTSSLRSSRLTDFDRFEYLLDCVKGEAYDLIKGIPLLEENYQSAIKVLRKRFENRRLNLRLFLNKLFQLPSAADSDPDSLRKLITTITCTVRALENMDFKLDLLSSELISQLVVTKLDKRTRELWEMTLSEELAKANKTEEEPDDNKPSSYTQLMEFLELRLRVLSSVFIGDRPKKESSEVKSQRTRTAALVTTTTTANGTPNTPPPNSAGSPQTTAAPRSCPCCNQIHPLYQCANFKALSIADRYKKVRDERLCVNCFSKGHYAAQCRSIHCRQCNKLHHTLLHSESTVDPLKPPPTDPSSGTRPQPNAGPQPDPKVVVTVVSRRRTGGGVLLATAIVTAKSAHSSCEATILLDGASHTSFVTTRLQKQLNLPTSPFNVTISGIGSAAANSSLRTKVQLSARDSSFSIDLSALVIDRITEPLPCDAFTIPPEWQVEGIRLADPKFNEPKEIDILIGADTIYDILQPEFLRRPNLPVLQSSRFGWLLAGPYSAPSLPTRVHCCKATVTSEELHAITQFLDADGPPRDTDKQTSDERECERIFDETYQRDETGRFIVALPRRPGLTVGESRNQAVAQLRRTRIDDQYQQFMTEYEDLGHMTRCAPPTPDQEVYYLPHHAVYHNGKIRVVFNASAPSSNGDVIKLYRQILRAMIHRDLQRILASDGEADFPAAAEVLRRETYMDDSTSGADTIEAAQQLRDDLVSLLKTAGMEFSPSKWRANHPALQLPSSEPIDPKIQARGNVLGIEWDTAADTFLFSNLADLKSPETPFTRRTALSLVAKIFDPLGWLSPLTVTGKLLIQELWLEKADWDDQISPSMQPRFNEFVSKIPVLADISIYRYLGTGDVKLMQYEVHGFSDASKQAFAACVYIRQVNGPDVTIRLVQAKTRVAPRTTARTIPQLELCAALLLVELLKEVCSALDYPINRCKLYTDSTIVLAYLAKDAGHWKPFEANRVRKITEVVSVDQWRHIPGELNPADLATRDDSFEKFLANQQLWLCGPEFLHQIEDSSGLVRSVDNIDPDFVVLTTRVAVNPQPVSLVEFNFVLHRTSQLCRLKRTIGHIVRLGQRIRAQSQGLPEPTGALTAAELSQAFDWLIRVAQASSFPAEIRALQQSKPVPKKSSLVSLTPFLDNNGVLRVGGRLANAALPFHQKHPILLHATSRLATLIIRDTHHRYFHAGERFILNFLRSRYWFNGNLSNAIKKCVHTCARCIRFAIRRPEMPLMGDLPAVRVNVSLPFNDVGIDYAGPISTRGKACTARGPALTVKSYFAIFVCMTTKAVHLEVVSELTTDAFIATLRRFAARRGFPQSITSDNGTNFVGADAEFQKWIARLAKDEAVQNFSADNGFRWVFNPPSAPHMGGLYEAAVNSVWCWNRSTYPSAFPDWALAPFRSWRIHRTYSTELYPALASPPATKEFVLAKMEQGISTSTPET
ncbi:uncharacterized protein LOC135834091 [Planococcus citri]|uniref:uncharacterized protein LOC135834091 n=1 Tax=Planococcus citri TaxID=170843 RepID=UPI0031F7B519